MDPVERFGYLFRKSGPGLAIKTTEEVSQPLQGLTTQRPVREMATLSLKRPRKRKLPPTTPPTWGQLKTLTQRAERVLETTRSTKSPERLFLAMLAVGTCASGVGEKHAYWAYVPHPPLLRLAEWTEYGPIFYSFYK
ncbi:endogenous retrovirus group K member 25 Env polyprotein-like [Zalophus californianus]|uniref:Endogenous retrovirus group K member 25 Env polyprotein-like n=1 Tax=Zalophus californianus TaxID=9704 RepID=A0A6J2DVF0_ZALCA|nr:endogenous retrovirus group K member 25 Env polyprotein-like [Zalophus californianus]